MGVSGRVVALSFFLLVLFAPAGFYGELTYRGIYSFSSSVPAMAPLFVLFVLTGVNPWLRRLGWRPFTRQELVALYAIVLVGGPLISHGVLPWLLPYNIAQQYLARAVPEWQTTYLQYVPAWFGPTNVEAAEGYFVGSARVPWSLWWTPLAAWLSFLVALFLCPLCLVTLMRRQWISHERLSFPIAQVPLEMVSERRSGRGGEARLPVGWFFWVGFLIPFCAGIWNKLGRLFPSLPGIPFSGLILMQGQQTGPLAGLGTIELNLTPYMIAIAYLIPKDLSFSCWFFWFLRVAMTVAAISFGATPEPPEGWYGSGFPAPHHQGGGAVLALLAWTLWTGRKHLARSLRLAFSRPSGPRGSRTGNGGQEMAEDDEPLAYRWVVIGLVVSFAYMVGFCVLAGARVAVAIPMVGLIVTYYVMWARVRAETGLGFISFPFRVDELMVVPLGSAVFRPQEAMVLYNLRWAYFPGFGDSFEVSTGNALDAFKVADAASIRSQPLFRAMLVGFLVSMVAATYAILTGMYHYGFLNVAANNSGWLGPQLRFIGDRIYDMIVNPTGFDLNGIIAVAAGAAVTIGLGVMRLRLWWWPFHPVGYLAAACWGMHLTWMPFFVGWACKVVVVRYGGLRLYRQTVPLAVGLIVGDFVSQGIWVVVSILTRGGI